MILHKLHLTFANIYVHEYKRDGSDASAFAFKQNATIDAQSIKIKIVWEFIVNRF